MRIEESKVDNNLRELHNSSYYMKGEFNNCFITHLKDFKVLNTLFLQNHSSVFLVQSQKVDVIYQAAFFVSSCLCSAKL